MVKKLFLFSSLLLSSAYTQPLVEKKLVIVVTSYNNADWFDRNLGTLFFQKNPDGTGLYENYRIIYVDDCSYDNTAELVEQYVYACNQQHRVTIIKNKTRKRAMANLYYALQLCEPDEIVFNYDGDDWLANDSVFAMINEIYQNPNIWITYGSFINWPTDQMGYCKPFPDEYIEKQLFRKKWWMPGQLRTFYASLFHQIPLKDLFFEGPYFQGQFFPANADLAIYYPMMEMAGYHYKYIPDVIYIRNVATPINDFKANKDVQVLGSKLIREKEVYAHIESPRFDYFETFKSRKADCIIFCQNPSHAATFIASLEKLTRNLNTLYLLYNPNVVTHADAYKKLSSKYNLQIIPADSTNFKNQLLQILAQCHDHILFAQDQMIINKYIDFSESIYLLERAFAYGFFFSLGEGQSTSLQTGLSQPLPALNQINKNTYAWAFHYAQTGDWRCYNNLSCTLYRTKMIQEQFASIDFGDHHELFHAWQQVPINLEQVGLCYEQSCIGYINWY